jgi:hypothetical protein
MSPAVLAISLFAAISVAFVVSVLPAFRVTRTTHGQLSPWLARERAVSRPNRTVLVTQIATTLMILASGVVVARSLHTLSAVSPGFDPSDLIFFDVQPTPLRYAETDLPQLADRIVTRLSQISGVTSVTAAGTLSSRLYPGRIVTDGSPRSIYARWLPVRQNFFEVLRVPLRAGRTFAPSDAVRPPAAVVIDEDLAKALYGREAALGRHLRFTKNAVDLEIVGVVARIMSADKAADLGPMAMYFPETALRADFDPENVSLRGSKRDTYGRTIAIRTATGASSLIPAIQSALADVDSRLAAIDMTAATRALDDKLRPLRVVGIVAMAFTAVAVSLTTIALYALVSTSVIRRTREIAIRISLGSTTFAVVTTVIAETSRLIVAGVVIGLAGAMLIGQGLQSSVPAGMQLTDPIIFVDVLALVGVIGLIATVIPLSRALRISPTEALKVDY